MEQLEQKDEPDELDWAAEVYDHIPSHWQLTHLTKSERLKRLRPYAVGHGVPHAISDVNGLTQKYAGSQKFSKVVIGALTAFQRNELDALRVAGDLFTKIRQSLLDDAVEGDQQLPPLNGEQLANQVLDLVDIINDTTTIIAKLQECTILEHLGHKSASVLSKEKFDMDDTSILQNRHVDAVEALGKLHRQVSSATSFKRPSFQRGCSRGRGRGRGRNNNFRSSWNHGNRGGRGGYGRERNGGNAHSDSKNE